MNATHSLPSDQLKPRPRLIYYVHMAVALINLPVFAFLWADLALHPANIGPGYGVGLGLIIGLGVSLSTLVVGILCLRRAPGNPIGAILILWATASIGTVHGPLYTTWLAAWTNLFGGFIWVAFFLMFSYFPDGHVFPRRFEKWIDGFALATYAIGVLAGLALPTALSANGTNPIHVAALAPFASLLTAIDLLGAFIILSFGSVTLILRYRAGEQRVRQQMKWLLLGLLPVAGVTLSRLALTVAGTATGSIVGVDVVGALGVLWLQSFPAFTIGNAILRHRLYDIDIIIRRTLIYGVLTGILAAVYFGTVVLVQQVFRALTGQTPEITIVISTLVIAALFTPLRRRIQNVIDQRLYRRKYDAEKTLAAFSRTLREDVDLETLKGTLIGVVQKTMQPTHVALWVREPGHTVLKEQVK